jgi:hypothetical protein
VIPAIAIDGLDAAVRATDTVALAAGTAADELARLPVQDEVACLRIDPASCETFTTMFGLEDGPALVILRQGIVLFCESGERGAAAIGDLLGRIRRLDMDAVRADIEQQRQAELAVRMRRVCPTARRGRPG